MSHLSRHSLVTSAAALPALAVPAVVMASIEPDPIFAAIEAYREAAEASSRLWYQLDEAEDAIADHPPTPLIIWRNHMIGGSEIDDMRDRLLAEPDANPKRIERAYQAARARERAHIAAHQQWYERNGLAGLLAESHRLGEAERAALQRLAETYPTTIAGAGALLDYVIADMEAGDHESQPAILANVADALRRLAVQS